MHGSDRLPRLPVVVVCRVSTAAQRFAPPSPGAPDRTALASQLVAGEPRALRHELVRHKPIVLAADEQHRATDARRRGPVAGIGVTEHATSVPAHGPAGPAARVPMLASPLGPPILAAAEPPVSPRLPMLSIARSSSVPSPPTSIASAAATSVHLDECDAEHPSASESACAPSRRHLRLTKGEPHAHFIALGQLGVLGGVGHAGFVQPQPRRPDLSPARGEPAGLLGEAHLIGVIRQPRGAPGGHVDADRYSSRIVLMLELVLYLLQQRS